LTVSSSNTVIISPIGNFQDDLLDSVVMGVKTIFGCRTAIDPLLEGISFALDRKRDQYYSTIILEKLTAMAPDYALKVLACTTEDLFIPILTHVYGEAQLGGNSCIVSTFRLAEGLSLVTNRESFVARIVKEAVHELGHTFKLRHCRDRTCIMHYCRNIRDVDRKSNILCRHCSILLDDEKKRLSKGKT